MAIRREIRLRKEFLHRKQIDVNEMIKVDKKRKIKEAIDEGKAIPTELRAEARALKHEMELDLVALDDRCVVDFSYLSVAHICNCKIFYCAATEKK